MPNWKRKTLFSISTRRLAESVEGLNNSLALAVGDLWPKKGRPIAAIKGIKAFQNHAQAALDTSAMDHSADLCLVSA